MLVLNRKPGERIVVGDVVVTQLERGRIGIDAPRDVKIMREEVVARIQAAEAVVEMETDF